MMKWRDYTYTNTHAHDEVAGLGDKREESGGVDKNREHGKEGGGSEGVEDVFAQF